MHRFFIFPEHISDNMVVIDKEQARHVEKVLRLQTGDFVVAFDGQGCEYELELMGRQNGVLMAEIKNKIIRNNEPQLKISLVQGLAKGDKMDSIIQKAVEIGVTNIYPLISKHAVVRMEKDKALHKVERWQVISREACKQCRRNSIPKIHMPVTLQELFNQVGDKPVIMLYENKKDLSLKEIIISNRSRIDQGEIFLIVGPEGGFSADEVEFATGNGAIIGGLGPRILRTETAGLVASAILLYEMGDLQ